MNFHRIVHTVGQGAFYSEHIGHFRMVYDCGSATLDRSLLKKRVDSDFQGNTDIDLLFISHFDADHVNGVRFFEPDTVILPFISKVQLLILKLYNLVFGDYYDIELAERPETVFPDAHIIRVMPDNFEGNNNPDDENPVFRQGAFDLYDIESNTPLPRSIASNSRIRFNEKWEFIPYNPNWDKFAESFRKKVEKELDWSRLTGSRNGAYVKKYQSVLKDIYNSLRPKNSHSLIVYSNSIEPMMMRPCSLYYHYLLRPWHDCKEYPAGCIYFGDITVKNPWLSSFFINLTDDRLRRLGMIQMPHHGSYLSHGEYILQNKLWPFHPVVCAISAEGVSRYGHPSAGVIFDLELRGGMVVVVTEAISTLLVFRS